MSFRTIYKWLPFNNYSWGGQLRRRKKLYCITRISNTSLRTIWPMTYNCAYWCVIPESLFSLIIPSHIEKAGIWSIPQNVTFPKLSVYQYSYDTVAHSIKGPRDDKPYCNREKTHWQNPVMQPSCNLVMQVTSSFLPFIIHKAATWLFLEFHDKSSLKSEWWSQKHFQQCQILRKQPRTFRTPYQPLWVLQLNAVGKRHTESSSLPCITTNGFLFLIFSVPFLGGGVKGESIWLLIVLSALQERLMQSKVPVLSNRTTRTERHMENADFFKSINPEAKPTLQIIYCSN